MAGQGTGSGVTGIGGLFVRSHDPDALRLWYVEHLGIGDANGPVWMQAAGPTVFMPFATDSDYFAADKTWMLNLRTDDLDALVTRLRGEGIATTTDPDWDTPETGRFARLHDPDGNAIELWQPPE